MPGSSAVSRAALLLAAVVAVDQLAKALVRARVDVGSADGVLPGLEIVHVRNRGVAFGAFAGQPVVMVVVLGALAGLLVWFVLHRHRPHVWIPTGLLLGGALGNIVDRLRDGYVTDFLKIPLWPSFNLADVFIVTGVLVLLWVLERGDGAERTA